MNNYFEENRFLRLRMLSMNSTNAEPMSDSEGFRLVKKGGRPRQRQRVAGPGDRAPASHEIVAAVARARDSYDMKDYASAVASVLEDVVCEDVLCYGIGLFGTCFIARHQLALLLLLSAAKQAKRVLLHDPVLRTEERSALEMLGCHFIPENELCRRKVQTHTLVFMPHCGRAMYNNLLWANWSPENLAKLTLIGNSFLSYLERTPQTNISSQDSYIFKAVELCQEKPLPPYVEQTIFNDLSVHRFPMARLLSAPPSLWQPSSPPPPDASDPELIS